MTDAQPVTRPTANPAALAAPVAGGNRRYLETRLKALELFARCGFSRVSMRDLAAHLGIKAGSIYQHIESKEALLFELIEELYEQLLHGASLASRRQSSPATRLHGLLEAHLRLHESMGAHFRLAEYDLHCLGSEQQARILGLRRRYEERLVATIEQLTGEPASATRRATLSGIVSLLNQLPAWVGETPASGGARLDLLRDVVMSALRGALRATQGSCGEPLGKPPTNRPREGATTEPEFVAGFCVLRPSPSAPLQLMHKSRCL